MKNHTQDELKKLHDMLTIGAVLKHKERRKVTTNKSGKPHTQVEVSELPQCDFCRENPLVKYQVAHYDFKTRMGPWAYGCREHFKKYGIKLGLGFGQELVICSGDKDGTRTEKG